MTPFPEPEFTIEETSEQLGSGILSAVDVVRRCLDRFDARESEIRAWVVVDREGAMARARELDRDRKDWGQLVGPLHGIPVGIKDIIDVKGFPTRAGARHFGDGKPADEDADVVANLRKAGAIILGKTVTTPYAWIDPPPTRNPWNLDRTPGGSSSGSAAAVAAGMCLGAVGTQTGGSIIRPAAFCGICGFKPERWRMKTKGIVPFAPSLDTVGVFASSVEGLCRLYAATFWSHFEFEHEKLDKDPEGKDPRRRVGRLRGPFEQMADPEAIRAVDRAAGLLERAGATVIDVELSGNFEENRRAHRTIMAAEAAVEHRARFAERPDDYPPRIASLILEGVPTLASDYIEARSAGKRFHKSLAAPGSDVERFRSLCGDEYAFLMPAALGPAPDPSTTGDPAFNSIWTFLDFPVVTLPVGLSEDGLPLGVQLIHPRENLKLIRLAAWCESAFRTRAED